MSSDTCPRWPGPKSLRLREFDRPAVVELALELVASLPLPAEAITAAAAVEAARNGLEYRPRDGGKSWALVRPERRLVLQFIPGAETSAEVLELESLLGETAPLLNYNVWYRGLGASAEQCQARWREFLMGEDVHEEEVRRGDWIEGNAAHRRRMQQEGARPAPRRGRPRKPPPGQEGYFPQFYEEMGDA